MRVLRAVGLIAASFALFPSAALADCYSLRMENDRLKREFKALAEYEWGSAIVFGGCVAVGMDSYRQHRSESDALGAVAVCAAAGCGLTTNYGNCLKVNATLFLYALHGSMIEDQLVNC